MQGIAGIVLRLAATGLSLLSLNAHATFHLWQIDQVYSDASGAVQYIEFATASPGQEFLTGLGITTAEGARTHTSQFPTNLPTGTTNHKFLIATNGFVALGTGVTPDYTVPNGFLFLPGGSINYAGSTDLLLYTALPTDGTHAINRSGTPVLATPTNFAGSTPATPLNVPPPVQAGPMDVDQNGQVDALTDGLLLLRYMLGLRGAALIQGAIGAGAARNTSALIETYLGTCIAGSGSVC